MGKLTDKLKRVLEGLAYQDAADYLSADQKLEVLGIEPPRKCASPVGSVSRRFGPGGMGRRIALIYLVATVADDLARELTERILQTAGVQVPLVLVRGHTPPKSFSVYAA